MPSNINPTINPGSIENTPPTIPEADVAPIEVKAAAPKDVIVEQNGIPKQVTPIEVVAVHKTSVPQTLNAYDLLPEKTKAEMRAGSEALGNRFDEAKARKHVIEDAAGAIAAKSMELYKANFGKATQSIIDVDAFYDHEREIWMTRVTVIGAGAAAEPTVVQEPFSQFPSDEMKTWVGITVV